MSTHTCITCKKTFSNNSNLKHHIETAKYCLKLRNKKVLNKKYPCTECKKVFLVKNSLDRHIIICQKVIDKKREEQHIKEINEYKEQLNKKDEHIKELESKLENIALKAVTKSSTTNITQHNNRIDTINNLIPLTDEHIKEQVEFFTLEHIKQGPSGFSQYALDYPLKNRIACTDFARRKLKYKNADGQIVTDLNMNILSKKLFSALQSKNRMLSYQYAQELQDFILNETINVREDMDEKEAETFTMKNERFVDIITDIYSQVRQVNEISEGKKTELSEQFLKELCSKITV
jgi:urease gamma subunit